MAEQTSWQQLHICFTLFMFGGPRHLSSFHQRSEDLIENLLKQLVYSVMEIINIWVLISILLVKSIIIISIVNIKFVPSLQNYIMPL